MKWVVALARVFVVGTMVLLFGGMTAFMVAKEGWVTLIGIGFVLLFVVATNIAFGRRNGQ